MATSIRNIYLRMGRGLGRGGGSVEEKRGPADDGKRSDSFRSWTFHLEPEATNLNCLLERKGIPRERMNFERVLIEGWRFPIWALVLTSAQLGNS